MSDVQFVSSEIILKDLNAFVSVAMAGSFRQAAAQLLISQPAVSRSVARLENQLDAVLLERGPRGAVLTPIGQSVLARARKVLSSVREMREETTGSWTSSIHLGAAATAAGSFLAPFLAEWIPSHPDIRLQVLEDGAARLRKRLDAGECDIAIIAAPLLPQFEARLITHVSVRAYFPPNHPLATSTSALTLTELAKHRLLVNGLPFLSTKVLLDSFEVANIQPQVIYESSSGQTLAALAEAGMGVAVFGNSVDIRGSSIASRAVMDRTGAPLGFDLYIAWPKKGTPDLVRNFGIALAHFSSRRRDS
jgi:DNA-binding transcriptional LysR family regulator